MATKKTGFAAPPVNYAQTSAQAPAPADGDQFFMPGPAPAVEPSALPVPSVSQAIRANAPGLPALNTDAAYSDPDGAQMVGGFLDEMDRGPGQVPRPEILEPMTVGEVLKRQLIGMVPFYGPARETVERQKEAAAAQDWERRQGVENSIWEERQKFFSPIVQKEIEANREIQRSVSRIKFMRAVFPNATDDMMANFARQVMGVKAMDRKNVRVVTPWSQQGVPAMQDETGQITYQDPTGNTVSGLPGTDVNIMKVLPMISNDEASGVSKWQADRAMKWAMYNKDVAHQTDPNYIPSDLDYAQAEKHWNTKVGGDSVAREKYVALVEAYTGKPFEEATPEERYRANLGYETTIARARADAGVAMIPWQDPATGQVVNRFVRTTEGAQYDRIDPVSMLAVEEARSQMRPQLLALESLSKKTITTIGPEQRAKALKEGVEAVFGNNPNFRTYVDLKRGMAVNLAKIINGGRPSDKDTEAAAGYLPDPYRDTTESAAAKWKFLEIATDPDAEIPVRIMDGSRVAWIKAADLGAFLRDARKAGRSDDIDWNTVSHKRR